MNARSLALAAIAFAAITSAFADASKREEPRRVVREQTLLQELGAGMREILVAVTPEISLPKLELQLPRLDRR
jgi:hypothetical protein